jgi:FlaA1/EpsC-like NDP-sugar epimerase
MQAKKLSKATVLVTGAGGFISSRLCEYLLSAEGLEKTIQWFRAHPDRSKHHFYYMYI